LLGERAGRREWDRRDDRSREQRAEGRGQRAEGRGQRAESREQKANNRGKSDTFIWASEGTLATFNAALDACLLPLTSKIHQALVGLVGLERLLGLVGSGGGNGGG
jgi:hypothetical protein